ncbi:MAG: hypothetical protein HXS46_02785 [Theionarchaea archaeon]|nr:MAG: hypothetical protein AYK18_13015 [Theionarchaea archaeon DG-70]MBU7009590.1 hypothetical protein [Theionarchaea archaeon]
MAVVIALDLDKFSEMTKKMGWTEYSPNVITRFLSHAVTEFARNHHATILHGVDVERGTEEAQIYCSDPDLDVIVGDLEQMRTDIQELGASLSVGIANVPSEISARLLKDFPLAKKALRESKRKKKIVLL